MEQNNTPAFSAPDALAARRSGIEKSIRTTYHERLFTPFAQAVRKYQLVQKNDKIAVCISGGKDSMLMAKLFQALQAHHAFPFSLEFLAMDPGYRPENRQLLEENAQLLGLPLTLFESPIFDAVYQEAKNPCYLCARMRRGYLYSKAQALGCNKIALGHHYDDVIETTLMSMLYGGQVQTMLPKLRSANYPGMTLIRPMYLIREGDIRAWQRANALHFLQCACLFGRQRCCPGGQGAIQTAGNQAANRPNEKDQSRRGGEHFQQHGKRLSGHGAVLQAKRAKAFFPGTV